MSVELSEIAFIVKGIACEEILPNLSGTGFSEKEDGSLVTDIDHRIQRRISEWLEENDPTTPLLGEEMEVDEQQRIMQSSRYWCLDPLDGTTNFTAGFPCVAISLALIDRDGAALGVVYNPVSDELFTAKRGEGAWLNGERLCLPVISKHLNYSVALVDFKKMPNLLATVLVTDPPYASQRSIGSVALDWCWMAAGRADLYIHFRQGLWDFAAGLLIFMEAGGEYRGLYQQRLDWNSLDKQAVSAARSEEMLSEWNNFIEKHR